jgi:hypothetical protein
LRYYREPQKIEPCVAGYIPEITQYNIQLEYKPGATNRVDALSCRPNYEVEGNPNNKDITVLPDKYFCDHHMHLHVMDWDSLEDALEQQIRRAQYPEQSTLKKWAPIYNLTALDRTHWYYGTALVIVVNDELRRGVISLLMTIKPLDTLELPKPSNLLLPTIGGQI